MPLSTMMVSLKNLCRIKVAVTVSSLPDVKNQIFNFSPSPFETISAYEEWKIVIQSLVSQKFEKLPPRLVKIIPDYLILLIGLQMLKWAKFLQSSYGHTSKFWCNFMNASIFTPDGIIDEHKLARKLVKEMSLSTYIRYKVACHFYLVDVIPDLWLQIRGNLSNFEEIHDNLSYQDATVIWSEYLTEKEMRSSDKNNNGVTKPLMKSECLGENQKKCNCSIDSNLELTSLTDQYLLRGFRSGVKEGNMRAIKYIWNIISRKYINKMEKKNEYIDHSRLLIESLSESQRLVTEISGNREMLGNILAFILRQMNNEQKKEFLLRFRESFEVLKCFLHYPYQNMFMNTAELVMQSLNGFDFYRLIHNIVDFMLHSDLSQTYDYQLLLEEFWIKSPIQFKKYVILAESGRTDYLHVSFVQGHKPLLLKLLSVLTTDDSNIYYLILENASSEDKRFIFTFQGRYMCLYCIRYGKFEWADLYLASLNLSKETVTKFRKDLSTNVFRIVMESEDIDIANEFVNWAVPVDEIDNFKLNVFSDLLNLNFVITNFLILDHSIIFLKEILLWILNSEEKLEEWKKCALSKLNLLLSPGTYDTSDEIDKSVQFFKWIGFIDEKV